MLFVSALTACNALALPQAQSTPVADTGGCIAPLYGSFSYPVEADIKGQKIPGFNMFVLPPPPWQVVAPLPEIDAIKNWEQRTTDVIQTRQMKDYSEIWVHISEGLEKQAYLAVYRTDSKEWKVIPEQIDTLTVDKNGALWGSHSGSQPGPADDRILTQYDEKTGTFIADKDVQNLASGMEMDGIYYYSQVLLDAAGKFWILVPGDGIYRYDPGTKEVKRFFDLTGIFSDAKIGPDGTIRVLIHNVSYKAGNLQIDSFLNSYSPLTGKTGGFSFLERLEPYPLPVNMLIDHLGRIWLDNIVYYGADGNLYQIQRSPLFISPSRQDYTDYRYKTAKAVLESSDGRLWFLHPNNGMISLDPQTNEWCWFTTYKSNMAEDQQHNLWMVADRKLYKDSLKP